MCGSVSTLLLHFLMGFAAVCSSCIAANIILEDTYERHVADGMFCDIELGLNIIRCVRFRDITHVLHSFFFSWVFVSGRIGD